VVSEPPPEFYYQSGAGAIAGDILMGLVYLTSLIFLLTALGFILHQSGAKGAALFLSSMSAFVWLLGFVTILTHPTTAQDLALATLFLATIAGNVIAIYINLTSHTRINKKLRGKQLTSDRLTCPQEQVEEPKYDVVTKFP